MLDKMQLEFPKIKIETLLAWSCAAKNGLTNNTGFSPNQIVFGKNIYLPNVIDDNLPALSKDDSDSDEWQGAARRRHDYSYL